MKEESVVPKYLLVRAVSEIQHLREENKIMSARLEMFDAVMSALHGQPYQKRPKIYFDNDVIIAFENLLKQES